MRVVNQVIKLSTQAKLEFIDLTDKIHSLVKKSSIQNGLINIQSLHTTMAIIIQEAEPLLIKDLKKTLEKVASQKAQYVHDNFEIRTVNINPNERKNGHSHCKCLFLTPNVILNIYKNKLQIGRWQSVFAVELDGMRERQVSVQILGI